MSGYREESGGGARVRADVVECHVVRVRDGAAEFLQLLRAREPLRETWQPVLGHCEPGEGSVACAVRELREEIGLDPSDDRVCEGLFALEQVRPFYVWAIDAVVLGPRFAAVVRERFRPVLNNEHTAHRWTRGEGLFWHGQREAAREIELCLLDPASPAREALRVRT